MASVKQLVTSQVIKTVAGVKTQQVTQLIAQRPFANTYSELSELLDGIKKAAPTGKPTPPQAKSPGVTDEGAKAYGNAYGKAKAVLQKAADALTPEQVNAMSGLGFTKPADDKAKRTDIVNSALTAWDKSASSYMKNQQAAGDTARTALQARLNESDKSIAGPQPRPPVKPDT